MLSQSKVFSRKDRWPLKNDDLLLNLGALKILTYLQSTKLKGNIGKTLSSGVFYSETTWAVGIAQLTHHEVQGGGQKSRDRRSRDFCPHRGPSGELIAQYRPSMSFCFYPTLYLGNHLYFSKPDSSWKQQKNTRISEIDSVHSTKRVVMVTPQHLLVTS